METYENKDIIAIDEHDATVALYVKPDEEHMDERDHLRKTLEHYRMQRQQKLDEARAFDGIIRQLERDLGEQSTVEDSGIAPGDSGTLSTVRMGGLSPLHNIRPDEFFAMSQSDAAKAYLRKVGFAIPFDELVTALRKGGARLGGADPKKSLYVSLARNPRKEFVWPSKDHIGLQEFYDRKEKD